MEKTIFQALSFYPYLIDFLSEERKNKPAMSEHPQIAALLDVIRRRDHHHARLTGFCSEKLYLAFLQGLAASFEEGFFPYLDAKKIALQEKGTQEKITQDFIAFAQQLEAQKKIIRLATNAFHHETPLGQYIRSALDNAGWRIILIGEEANPSFNTLSLIPLTELQGMRLLKAYKEEIEPFHQVTLSDDIVSYALKQVKHYVTRESYFDKTLELLDSASARASQQALTTVDKDQVIQVLSNHTRIPIANLQENIFQPVRFREYLERNIAGQEGALIALSHALQQVFTPFYEKPGPLGCFLFVGPSGTGKSTAVSCVTDCLFGQPDALLRVNPAESATSLSDITVHYHYGGKRIQQNLLSAIRKKPYAVILIENSQQMSPAFLNLFKSILLEGYGVDSTGHVVDCRRCIVVMTTTVGADRILALMEAPPIHEVNKTLDLMDLVMNTPIAENVPPAVSLSVSDMCEELMPLLENHFPSDVLHAMQLIPFMALDYTALEKIMRSKLKAFAKRLETQWDIELTYSPEVVSFLAHEALWRKSKSHTVDQILEHFLYSVVAKEVLAYAENKNRPRRLYLQLNENGSLLRCAWSGAFANQPLG